MACMMKFKSNVKTPMVVVIAVSVLNAANQVGITSDRLCTSGNDSVHDPHSAHYTDEALDFRCHDLTPDQKHGWFAAIQQRLGTTFTVLLEDEGKDNEHIHVQVKKEFRKQQSASEVK